MSEETDSVKFCEDCRWAVVRKAPIWATVLYCSCPLEPSNRIQRGMARWSCECQRSCTGCNFDGTWWEAKT